MAPATELIRGGSVIISPLGEVLAGPGVHIAAIPKLGQTALFIGDA